MKREWKIFVVTAVVFMIPFLKSEALTPEEARSFLQYYYHGQGEPPVLAWMKVCKGVVKEGDRKNECDEEVSPDSLVLNEKYYLWMLYVVPQGEKVDNIIVQFTKAGVVVKTLNVSVTGSIRYRTWRTFRLNSPGDWEIKVIQLRENSPVELGSLRVTVVKPGEKDTGTAEE